MKPFSFLHCADLHLGAPFQGLTDLPPELAERLREAPIHALDRIVATAIERRVAAVIIAGDVFDAADRNLRAQIQLRERLEKLDAAGIPTLIAAGNHDPLGTAVASIRYPDSVFFFDTQVDAYPLMRGGETLAHIYGISHDTAAVRYNLAVRFPESPEGPFSIAVMHANVGGKADHDTYAPCALADLETLDFDYWALGHVHTRETLRSERPVVHYPGNTQGLHMRELGPRGATLVEVSASGDMTMSPVWTDVVRWHRVSTSIDDLQTPDDVLSEFAELSARTAAEAPDRLHVVMWTLTGSGPMHETLRRPENIADLTVSLRQEHAPEPLAGAVWLQSIAVETRPPRDIAVLRQQQDLLGDLLRLAEEARENPPRLDPVAIGSGETAAPEHPVTAAIREELEELLNDPRVRAVLGDDAWRELDWARLLRRAEVLAIEGLLAEDGGS